MSSKNSKVAKSGKSTGAKASKSSKVSKAAVKKTTIVQKVILPSLIYSALIDLPKAPRKIESDFEWKKLSNMDAKSTDSVKYQAPFTISSDLDSALDRIQEEIFAQLRLLDGVTTFPNGIPALNRELKELSNATIITDICASKPVDIVAYPTTRSFEDKKKGLAAMINVDGIFTKNSASKLVPIIADRYLHLIGHIAVYFAKMIMTSPRKYTLTARHLWMALYEYGISEDTLDMIADLITDLEAEAESKAKEKKAKSKAKEEGVDADGEGEAESHEPEFEINPDEPDPEE